MVFPSFTLCHSFLEDPMKFTISAVLLHAILITFLAVNILTSLPSRG